MPVNDELILELDCIAHGGEAIATWQNRPVFVPYGLPGEKVRARVTLERARYARAELLEVLQPSPDRVEAPCSYFGVCGGCQWQHANYRLQLDMAYEIVADQLLRLAGMAEPPLEGIVPADEPWAYRNRLDLYSMPEATDGPRLGLPSADGRTVVPIADCLTVHELVHDLISSLDVDLSGAQRLMLRAGQFTGERLALLETADADVPELELDVDLSFVHATAGGELTTLVGEAYLNERLGERLLRIHAPAWFPPNTVQTINLLEMVREFCRLQGGERVLDLYCGVGATSVDLAAQAGEVVGVEPSEWAAANAEHNGEGVPNFTIHEGPVEEVLPALEGNYPAVVASPPRTGLRQEAIAALPGLGARRLVYVTDDVATLARELAPLGQAGFSLERVLALDMCPQTSQVDVVALLTRPE